MASVWNFVQEGIVVDEEIIIYTVLPIFDELTFIFLLWLLKA